MSDELEMIYNSCVVKIETFLQQMEEWPEDSNEFHYAKGIVDEASSIKLFIENVEGFNMNQFSSQAEV
ncbi:hypothetical protein O9H85_13270 [Paenibacillus filicis]|uniref:Uncharacterized protein n=1 Tax=Paenibacillus gyeongsangnamensis TaxID=3388067 RepID=A0ABT4Q939_9BACL|nr:hypothetical protein [Paenibacillus filicis]MCZ8513380.1 hypothetical protein [Paenibacillus filicis]